MGTRLAVAGLSTAALITPSLASGESRESYWACSRAQQTKLINEQVDQIVDVPPDRTEFDWNTRKHRKLWREWIRKRWAIHDFDIPAQPLTNFMKEFATHTGLRACYQQSFDKKDLIVGPLKGRMLIDDAIVVVGKRVRQVLYGNLDNSSVDFFGRADRSPLLCDEPPAVRIPSSYVGPGCPGHLEFHVTVEGTRLASELGSPTLTVPQEEIQSYGVSTLPEFFRYLPQVPAMRSADSRSSGEQYVDLRGLGTGTTLVLINGRRVAPSAASFDNGGFDLNTIPQTAVKQVEVLLDSHSVNFGSDAVGGVINIVLKDEIPEPLLQLRYGGAHGGAEETRASIGAGMMRGRFHGAATLDYFNREFLLGTKREITRDQDFRRFGGDDMRSLEASPPNIRSLTGQNLPGLSSSFAGVPNGGDNLSIEDFYDTAGQRNYTSTFQFRSIVPKTSRASAIGSADLHLTDNSKLFGEFLATDRHNEYQAGLPTFSGVIPASNAFNPFGVPVVANATVEGIGGRRHVYESTVLRGVVGVSATLRDWTTELSLTWHDDDTRRWRENELNPLKMSQALSAADPNHALNFFRDGPPGSPTLLKSILADRSVQTFNSDHTGAQFSVQGNVADLPAGELRLFLGGEWRREGLSIWTPVPLPRLASTRDTSAIFGELQLPLVATQMEVPAIESLGIAIGIRRDDGDFGANVGAQYALSWRPLSDLSIRFSYRDFYRMPNLYDLDLPPFSVGPVPLPDPRRRNEISSVTGFAGGNPSLIPSTGQSWSARMEYVPSERLSTSVRYWHTGMRDRISLASTALLLNHEDHFSDRVFRAPPNEQDLQAGLPGRLVGLDLSPGNFGRLESDGVDFEIKGVLDTRFGRISPSLTTTWYHSYEIIAAPNLKPFERVDIASMDGTIPRWRALAGLGFEREKWTLFSAIRFVSSYDDSVLDERNGRQIHSSVQFDVQASMELDVIASTVGVLKGIRATAGAINLLDVAPAFSAVSGYGYDDTQADLRQRFWYLGFEKTF